MKFTAKITFLSFIKDKILHFVYFFLMMSVVALATGYDVRGLCKSLFLGINQ